jgi:hypothetical protein
MLSDILKVLWVNLFLLPGEAGFVALVMYRDDILTLGSGLCALGILFTVNFFITCAFQAHVREQKDKEERENQ